MAWEFDNDSCNPEPYTGSVCRTHLLKWQNCAVGPTESGIVAISTHINQAENEKLALEAFQLIG